MRCWNHLQEIKKGTLSAEGFTLIETLIAGLLLTLVMTAVGRMSVSALAGSSNISDRRRIEQAIENHIQLIQQADSLLTYDVVPKNHRIGKVEEVDEEVDEELSEKNTKITRACRKPAEYLATVLKQKGLINNTHWDSKDMEEEETEENQWVLVDKVDANADIQLFPSFTEPGRDIEGAVINTIINIDTEYFYNEDKAIVRVTYTFEAPEANVGTEKRILELSPNFQSACTPYEATGA